ncbi:hypothetical protein [Bradyrhizobium sp.]|uniref:hypothetical protein n=1 Tax=Bradyrhizobium sp. TaxID=376 RepID=UPI001DF0AE3A|nr:hypothetical protein [Bradyrhizobium sp.]MBI5319440.1 hypothetical protein [Bradyrhizobium sp.]
MRKTLLSMALVLLIGVPGSYAQSGGGSSTAAKNSSGVPTAPVGHRQPRAADFPDEKTSLNNPNDVLSRENALLDKKLKSICRGC